MKSRISKSFREDFAALPADVQKRARQAYRRFLENPNHPGLHFKLVDPSRSLYSVRIGRSYRALGVRNKDRIVWLWIGSHDDYEKNVGLTLFSKNHSVSSAELAFSKLHTIVAH